MADIGGSSSIITNVEDRQDENSVDDRKMSLVLEINLRESLRPISEININNVLHDLCVESARQPVLQSSMRSRPSELLPR